MFLFSVWLDTVVSLYPREEIFDLFAFSISVTIPLNFKSSKPFRVSISVKTFTPSTFACVNKTVAVEIALCFAKPLDSK